ncbi:MAG: alpha/beta family hydrolase [Acidobacteriota bacterium]
MHADETTLCIPVADAEVDGIVSRPENASALLVLAHGAGADMRHHGMVALASTLAAHGVASLRYQFPYRQAGRGRPDRPPTLVACVRAAVDAAHRLETGLPLFAGGRSMGGRMTSTAQAEEPLEGVDGLIFFAFPLHPAGKPGTDRAAHLAKVEVPMLFLQGTRDRLADRGLVAEALEPLQPATVHWLEGADHGFGVLKRSGRTPEDVLAEVGASVSRWITRSLRRRRA